MVSFANPGAFLSFSITLTSMVFVAPLSVVIVRVVFLPACPFFALITNVLSSLSLYSVSASATSVSAISAVSVSSNKPAGRITFSVLPPSHTVTGSDEIRSRRSLSSICVS
jgi:hypothetical protein